MFMVAARQWVAGMYILYSCTLQFVVVLRTSYCTAYVTTDSRDDRRPMATGYVSLRNVEKRLKNVFPRVALTL